jgi:hypothetical protein
LRKTQWPLTPAERVIRTDLLTLSQTEVPPVGNIDRCHMDRLSAEAFAIYVCEVSG